MTGRISQSRTLAELVAEVPARASVLERHGLDYCCGGARRLADACIAAHLDVDVVVAELEAIDPMHSPPPAPTEVEALVAHLLEHHRFLHEELPRLCELATKVLRVHGERHPDLADVHGSVLTLHADLEPHLMKEEMVLFPACRALQNEAESLRFDFGSIANPIRIMLREHDGTGAVLEQLSRHLDDHPLPDDACATYAALYDGIRAVIADTHEHVFEENHLLFPAVLELERDRQAQVAS